MQEMQETWVGSLGGEDPPEKEMATHSSTVAWKIPWTEELGGLQSMGSQRVRDNSVTEPACMVLCQLAPSHHSQVHYLHLQNGLLLLAHSSQGLYEDNLYLFIL